MGTAERKVRERVDRKESIIDAAQKVFFEKGLHLSTMDEIADHAELAKGTLYLYYRSKEDLYLAVMVRGLRTLRTMFEEIQHQERSIVPLLVDIVNTYVLFFEKHRNFFRMMHFFNTPQFHKQVSPEVMESCDTFNQSLWTMVTRIIRRGKKEKKIRADIKPIEVAVIMWTNASAMMMRIDNQHEMFKQKLHIDLNNTLYTANKLLLEAVLTEEGKRELHEIMK